MRRIAAACVVASAVAIAAAGCAPPTDGTPGADRLPVVEHLDVGGQAVTLTRHLNYGPGNLEYDLYQLDAAPVAPVVLFVHGGFWEHGSGKSKEVLPASVRNLVTEGWTVASMDYTGTNQGAVHPQQVVEVRQAVAHLAGQGFGPVRLVGHSAGGHLSLMAALTSDDPAFGPTGAQAPIAAVMTMAAPTNLASLAAGAFGEVVSNYACGSVRPCFVQPVHSPLAHVDPADPPVRLYEAQFDLLIPDDQADQLHTALVAAGVDATMSTVAGADHDSVKGAVGTAELDGWLSSHG